MGRIGLCTLRRGIVFVGLVAVLLARHDETGVDALVRRLRHEATTRDPDEHQTYLHAGDLVYRYLEGDPADLSAAYRRLEAEDWRLRYPYRPHRRRDELAWWRMIDGAQCVIAGWIGSIPTREAADALVGIITDPRVHHDGGKSLDLYDALLGCREHGVDAIEAFGPSGPNARFLAQAREDLLQMVSQDSPTPR